MEQVVRLLQSVTLRHDLDHRLYNRECQLVLVLPPVDGDDAGNYETGGDIRSCLAEAQSIWTDQMPVGGKGPHPLGSKTQYLADSLLDGLLDWHEGRLPGGRHEDQGASQSTISRHELCIETIGILRDDISAISSLRPLSGSMGGDRDRQWLWLWRFSPGHTAGPEMRKLVLDNWGDDVNERARPPGLVVRIDRAPQSAAVTALASRRM